MRNIKYLTQVILSGVLLWTFLPQAPLACAADDKYGQVEAEIPQKPSAPPPLEQKTSTTHLTHCQRFFLYKGEKYECDSNVRKDGERLRPILQNVPSALEELEVYQDNLRKSRLISYAISAGVVAMITGLIISRPPIRDGKINPGGYPYIGGAFLIAGSFIYGAISLRKNESHLNQAVQNYNAARPEDPIELQFSTGIHF